MAEKAAERPLPSQRRAESRARERQLDRLVEAYLRALHADRSRRPSRGEIRAILVDTESER